MKSLKGVIVGLLLVAALALVFNNLILPHLHWPARQAAASASAPAPSQAPGASLTPAIIPNVASNASNTPTAALVVDLSSAQTNAVRWINAPRRDPFLAQRHDQDHAVSYRTVMEVLTLKAIWLQTGGSVAVIDTRVVVPGDVIQGYKVMDIGVEGVWVDGPIGREELFFDHTASFRTGAPGSAMKPDGLMENPLVGQDLRLDWPYREVEGTTNNNITDPGWFPFSGKIVQKLGTGSYVVVGDGATNGPSPVAKGRRFIVKNLPMALVDDDLLPLIRCKYTGEELHDGKTLRVFDFGVLCAPPRNTAEAILSQQAFVLQQFDEASKRRMTLDLAAAERGNADSQFILGRRYLTGEGVSRDVQAGRRWLEKSADQGNRDALEALKARGTH